jgi:hypothetical protein
MDSARATDATAPTDADLIADTTVWANMATAAPGIRTPRRSMIVLPSPARSGGRGLPEREVPTTVRRERALPTKSRSSPLLDADLQVHRR